MKQATHKVSKYVKTLNYFHIHPCGNTEIFLNNAQLLIYWLIIPAFYKLFISDIRLKIPSTWGKSILRKRYRDTIKWKHTCFSSGWLFVVIHFFHSLFSFSNVFFFGTTKQVPSSSIIFQKRLKSQLPSSQEWLVKFKHKSYMVMSRKWVAMLGFIGIQIPFEGTWPNINMWQAWNVNGLARAKTIQMNKCLYRLRGNYVFLTLRVNCPFNLVQQNLY